MGISYHLHVFSLSQGHPTIALYTGDYYKTKLDGLIAFYGEPSRSINLAETGVDRIVEYVTDLENQYSDACAHVAEVNKQIAEENDWTITMVREKLIKIGRLPINV
jgi:polysaccharide pyruvyl transferase WcaK-like protein